MDRVIPGFRFRRRMAGRVESLNDYKAFGDDVDFTADKDRANVVTSRFLSGEPQMHLPVLDIDWPITAEPSSTPGHYHLYLDQMMSWESLVKLMDVMAEIGVLEPGYVEAAKIRGYTSVRLPWIEKGSKEASA